MYKKVIRSGNSLAVIIPSTFAKDLAIKKGATVEVKLDKPQNRLIYKFFGNTQLTLLQKGLK